MTPAMIEQRQLTDLEKVLAETGKLLAEQAKLNAEATKLQAEATKLHRDAFWQPVGIAAALIGTVATVTTLALKAMGLLT